MTASTALSDIQANSLPEQDKDRHKKEFLALLAVFERLVDNISEDWEASEIMEELMGLRADFGIRHAFDGFGMDYDAALELLRSSDEGLAEQDRERRDIVIAAVNNIVDFAVAEEYQMMLEILDEDELEDEDSEDIFVKYNDRYVFVENQDIEYAMFVASQLVAMSGNTTLMYMTQGDERVRPWHLQFEGFTAPKSQFPAWLIPPIEHACRCYLVEDVAIGSSIDVRNSIARVPDIPDWFNPTFKESVAFGGRIFSDEHPYFQIQSEHADTLLSISRRIKQTYFNG